MKIIEGTTKVRLETLNYGSVFTYDTDSLPGYWMLANEKESQDTCLTIRLSDGMVHRPTTKAEVIHMSTAQLCF